ncbi:MAG: uroporphyrinogen decarboxylase [Alphaproteobacteria bacterium]|nr:uroporphyrinogen decarboxylase [Alphaproteobacteria bacterium]
MTERPFLAPFKGIVRTRPPWWMLRQAGRYLPEYREVRSRSKDFLDLCFTPELAAEVTLQPIRRFGMDAAIVFSDILVIPHALGQSVSFLQGEGPKLEPIALERLESAGAGERLAPVYETIRRVRAALPDETALIGFAGSPWTVATYMIEGGSSRDFAKIKQLAVSDPLTFARLIDRVVIATSDYLRRQVEAGVDALQLFESWGGVLSEPMFRQWVIEPTRRIVDDIRTTYPAIPIIGFPRAAGALIAAYAAETGVDAINLDPTVPVAWAKTAMESKVLQGNLDPMVLVAGGQALDDEVRRILDGFADRPFVFNLGHGIVPETPPDHVAHVAELLRERG